MGGAKDERLNNDLNFFSFSLYYYFFFFFFFGFLGIFYTKIIIMKIKTKEFLEREDEQRWGPFSSVHLGKKRKKRGYFLIIVNVVVLEFHCHL